MEGYKKSSEELLLVPFLVEGIRLMTRLLSNFLKLKCDWDGEAMYKKDLLNIKKSFWATLKNGMQCTQNHDGKKKYTNFLMKKDWKIIAR